MTPARIEPATSQFVAQHLNHCATAVPQMLHMETYHSDQSAGEWNSWTLKVKTTQKRIWNCDPSFVGSIKWMYHLEKINTCWFIFPKQKESSFERKAVLYLLDTGIRRYGRNCFTFTFSTWLKALTEIKFEYSLAAFQFRGAFSPHMQVAFPNGKLSVWFPFHVNCWFLLSTSGCRTKLMVKLVVWLLYYLANHSSM